MRYISMFSGIEAASVAWRPLGWEPQAFAEIEPFPGAVLTHHYPDVPNLGDITKVDWSTYAGADLVCGGSPCQSFSFAGLRHGMADPRGNLALEYLRAVDAVRPRWVVWENVPGVLSSNGGRDFGVFLGALGQLGYGFAYRVMDAQYVRVQSHARAVPQRRRRVWLVGHLGDWRPAAAVLLERESLRGHPSPRREASIATRTLTGGSGNRGWKVSAEGARDGQLIPEVSKAICANDYKGSKADKGLGAPLIPEVARTLTHRYNSSPCADRGMNVIAFSCKDYGGDCGPIAPTLRSMVGQVAIATQDVLHMQKACNGKGWNDDGSAYTLDTLATQGVATRYAVRRLTPLECERLQGFPDGYTRIPWRGKDAEHCPDGPRYKALGNSWAVNVASWIGQRIQATDALCASREEHHA